MSEDKYLGEIRRTARDVTIAGKLGHTQTEGRLINKLWELTDAAVIHRNKVRIAGAEGTKLGLIESGDDKGAEEVQKFINTLNNKS